MFKLFAALTGFLDKKNTSFIVEKEILNLKLLRDTLKRKVILKDSFHHGGPCIAGASRLFMDVEGSFYPCERCSENSPIMKIGNLNTGLNYESVKRITNIGKITESECLNCWNVSLCSICATKADGINDFSKSMKLNACKYAKQLTENRIMDYLMVKEFGYDFNET